MNISGAEAARLLGVNANTITRYKRNGTPKSVGLACAALFHRMGEMEMIRAAKIVEGIPAEEEFDQWEWEDGDLAPFLKHIRTDTAKTIAGQIAEDCEGWISESDGLFNVVIFGDFIISFDILKALAVGQIKFEEISVLEDFSRKIDEVSANLHKALQTAKEGAAPEGTAPEVTS